MRPSVPPAERDGKGHLSRGHRVNNAKWEPRVGHDAAECLWRSILYRVVAFGAVVVYALFFFLAPKASYVAYAEMIVPLGCIIWSVIEFNRFQRRSGQTLGVYVGWGAGIPSDDKSYLKWCQIHELVPYPFRRTSELVQTALGSPTSPRQCSRHRPQTVSW